MLSSGSAIHYAHTPPGNSTVIRVFEHLAQIFSDLCENPLSHNKLTVSQTIDSCRAIILSDPSATNHAKTLLLSLIQYAEEYSCLHRSPNRSFPILLLSPENNQNYLAEREANASLDTLYIFAILFIVKRSIKELRQSRDLEILINAKNTLASYLNDKVDATDNTTLFARFLFTKLHYVYMVHLSSPNLINRNSPLFNLRSFHSRCEKYLTILNDKKENLTLDELCFKYLVSLYQSNAHFMLKLQPNGSTISEPVHGLLNKEYAFLFDEAFFTFVEQANTALASNTIRPFCPEDLRFTMFSTLVDEALLPIKLYQKILMEIILSNEDSLFKAKKQKNYPILLLNYINLLKKRIELLEWLVKLLSFKVVEKCAISQSDFDDAVAFYREELVLSKNKLQALNSAESKDKHPVKATEHSPASTAKLIAELIAAEDAEKSKKEREIADKAVKIKKTAKERRKAAKEKKRNIESHKTIAPTSINANAPDVSIEPTPAVAEEPENIAFINEIESFLPKHVKRIIYQIRNETGEKVFLTGGALRDLYFNLTPHDYDLSTTTDMKDILGLFSEVGNIISALNPTFRFAKQPDLADVDLQPLTTNDLACATHVEPIFTETLMTTYLHTDDPSLDALRRDFTCNAMYFDTETREILDPTGGLNDLKNKRIRLIGAAKESISNDPVVIAAIQREPIFILRGMCLEAKTPLRFSAEDKKTLLSLSSLLKAPRVPNDKMHCSIVKLLEAHNYDRQTIMPQLREFGVTHLEQMVEEHLAKASKASSDSNPSSTLCKLN